MTRYLLMARFADCHFDESIFPTLGGEKTKSAGKIYQYELLVSNFDPQKIIYLQIFTNQLPDAFTDSKKVTKTNVSAANAPIKVDVPVGQTNEIIARMKRGRPVGSKEKKSSKKKMSKE